MGPATEPGEVWIPVDEPLVVPVPSETPPPVMVMVNWSVGATRPTTFFCTAREPLKVQLARSVGVPEIPVSIPRSVMPPVFGSTR